MDASPHEHRPPLAAPLVSTTDWWKIAGLVLVLADHYGLFFDPDIDGWRVVGRIAAPIFFFLIGYAKTRTVPWTWIVLGVLLTAVDTWTTGEGLAKVNLNILINFAWLRLLRPTIERHVLGSRWRVAAAALAATLMIRPMQQVLEYGAEGWLWALLGMVQRRANDGQEPRAAGTRDLLAVYVAIVYATKEIIDYEFEGVDALALVPLVAGLAYLMTQFARGDSPWQPHPLAVAPIRWCGRHSLEIYGLSLLAMQLFAYAIA